MGKQSTRENKNIYQLCREAQGFTREKASEHMVGVSASRIEKIEYETQEPTPYDIIQMADCYKRPDLCNYYCSHKCAIGDRYIPEVEISDLSNIILETIASLNEINPLTNRLIQIARDGKISDDEIKDFAIISNGDKIGSGIPTILDAWGDANWRKTDLSQSTELHLVNHKLWMISLMPGESTEYLSDRLLDYLDMAFEWSMHSIDEAALAMFFATILKDDATKHYIRAAENAELKVYDQQLHKAVKMKPGSIEPTCISDAPEPYRDILWKMKALLEEQLRKREFWKIDEDFLEEIGQCILSLLEEKALLEEAEMDDDTLTECFMDVRPDGSIQEYMS